MLNSKRKEKNEKSKSGKCGSSGVVQTMDAPTTHADRKEVSSNLGNTYFEKLFSCDNALPECEDGIATISIPSLATVGDDEGLTLSNFDGDDFGKMPIHFGNKVDNDNDAIRSPSSENTPATVSSPSQEQEQWQQEEGHAKEVNGSLTDNHLSEEKEMHLLESIKFLDISENIIVNQQQEPNKKSGVGRKFVQKRLKKKKEEQKC